MTKIDEKLMEKIVTEKLQSELETGEKLFFTAIDEEPEGESRMLFRAGFMHGCQAIASERVKEIVKEYQKQKANTKTSEGS